MKEDAEANASIADSMGTIANSARSAADTTRVFAKFLEHTVNLAMETMTRMLDEADGKGANTKDLRKKFADVAVKLENRMADRVPDTVPGTWLDGLLDSPLE